MTRNAIHYFGKYKIVVPIGNNITKQQSNTTLFLSVYMYEQDYSITTTRLRFGKQFIIIVSMLWGILYINIKD